MLNPDEPSNDTACPVELPRTSTPSLRFGGSTLPPGLYLFRVVVSRAPLNVTAALGVDPVWSGDVVPSELQARTGVAFAYANVQDAAVRVCVCPRCGCCLHRRPICHGVAWWGGVPRGVS